MSGDAGAALLPRWVGLSADQCVKCNVCNTVCPVARVTDLFPGPKYVGPQAQRFRLASARPPQDALVPRVESPDRTVDHCSGCGYCTSACPAGVKIAEMNSRARASMRAARGAPLRDRLLAQTDLVGWAGVRTAPLANWSLRSGAFRWLLHRLLGIDRRAPLPAFARATFGSRWRRRRRSKPASDPEHAVVYFHGCVAQYYEARVAEAAIAVLERNGFTVIVPEQRCCGLPLISNGLYADARARARGNLAILAGYARRGYRIVGTSTSCTHTLKAEYREMLDLDDDDARVVAQATWDMCEFLRDLHERGRLDTRLAPIESTVVYHAPCQLRSHGIGLPALDVLALVPGLRVLDADQDCCGIAGTYGLKAEKYDIAMAVGEPLFHAVRRSGAALVLCDSETCRWQIEGATRTSARHPVELIAWSYAAADGAVPPSPEAAR